MNIRGQALVEAIIAGGVCFFSFSLLLKLGFSLTFANLIEESIEEHLLCKTTQNRACESSFNGHLQELGLKNFDLNYTFQQNVSTDSFKIESSLLNIQRSKTLNLQNYALK